MIIIGEKLNSSIPSALKAFNNSTSEAIIELIKSQSMSGADYFDINTAMLGDIEKEKMLETIKLIESNSDKGIMIDSVNMNIVRAALETVSNRQIIINSISLLADVSPLKDLNLSNIGVVAMPISEEGIPENAEKRLANFEVLVDKLLSIGFVEKNIFADILVETIAVNQASTINAVTALNLIKKKLPNIKTICGASNISFGLPKRKYINCSFIAMAIQNGLDSLIVDITNPDIKATILASEMLCNQDEYCINYIGAMRNL